MTWTAFRQERYVFWFFSLVAAVLIGWALVSGSHEEMVRARWLAAPCNGGNGIPIRDLAHCMALLHGSYGSHDGMIALFAGLLVILLGVLLGAGAVARDLERGTVRLTWTQSVTRTRWYATKVLVGLGSIVVICVPLSLTFNWWAHASSFGARISPKAFDLSGWMPLMISVLGFAVAVLVGGLLRRAGWTIAVALALLVLIGIPEQSVRYQLVPHNIATFSTIAMTKGGLTNGVPYGGPPANSWVLYSGFNSINSTQVPSSSVALEMNAAGQTCMNNSPYSPGSNETPCLKKLRIRDVNIYVSDRQFWTLQLRDGVLFLLGATLLLGVGAVVIRERRA